MKLGAQFYSIRDRSQNPEDLYQSFKKMKEIGYEIAQMSGICPMDPYKLLSYSEEFDLPITCTHNSFDRIVNDTDALIKEHKIFKSPVIGLGGMPDKYRHSIEGVRQFIKDTEVPVKKIFDAGLRFTYHNHAFEFEKIDGVMPFDVLIEEAPILNYILDVYWVTFGGQDPLKYIDLLGRSDRLTNLHIKDMKFMPNGPICACGEGVIDFKKIVDLCDSIGIPNALVEQDNAPDSGDSWGQMAISYKYLRPLFH